MDKVVAEHHVHRFAGHLLFPAVIGNLVAVEGRVMHGGLRAGPRSAGLREDGVLPTSWWMYVPDGEIGRQFEAILLEAISSYSLVQ